MPLLPPCRNDHNRSTEYTKNGFVCFSFHFTTEHFQKRKYSKRVYVVFCISNGFFIFFPDVICQNKSPLNPDPDASYSWNTISRMLLHFPRELVSIFPLPHFCHDDFFFLSNHWILNQQLTIQRYVLSHRYESTSSYKNPL